MGNYPDDAFYIDWHCQVGGSGEQACKLFLEMPPCKDPDGAAKSRLLDAVQNGTLHKLYTESFVQLLISFLPLLCLIDKDMA